MTRRDRAACVLALECLRIGKHGRGVHVPECSQAVDEARKVLDLGHYATWEVSDALRVCPLYQETEDGNTPLLRARLALYLRALLRADAGDCGPTIEHWPDMGDPSLTWRRVAFTPLWQLAGATRER